MVSRVLVQKPELQNVVFGHRGGIRRLVPRGLTLAIAPDPPPGPFVGPEWARIEGGELLKSAIFSLFHTSRSFACPVRSKEGRHMR